jgi:hypothetical protein
MPKWYTDCVASMESKGKEHKEAQKMCAILYYKKYGKPISHEKGEINDVFTENDLKEIEKPEFVLNYLFNKE